MALRKVAEMNRIFPKNALQINKDLKFIKISKSKGQIADAILVFKCYLKMDCTRQTPQVIRHWDKNTRMTIQ